MKRHIIMLAFAVPAFALLGSAAVTASPAGSPIAEMQSSGALTEFSAQKRGGERTRAGASTRRATTSKSTNVRRNTNVNTRRNTNVNVRRNTNVNVRRNTNVNVRTGAWVRPARYSWPVGGAIAAGAAIGFVGAATAAAWAGAAPGPGLCWYYTDASQRQGFWDQCP